MKKVIATFALFAALPCLAQTLLPLMVPITQTNLVTAVSVDNITVPTLANPYEPYLITASYEKNKRAESESDGSSVSAEGTINYLFDITVPQDVLEARVASFETNPPPAVIQGWLQSIGRDPAGVDAALVLIGQEACLPAIEAMAEQ